MALSRRNDAVQRAVRNALERVDDFITGEAVDLPNPAHRRACEDLIEKYRGKRGSVITASLFFMFYWLEVPDWDMDGIPVGIRGQYGDKPLSEQLTRRQITLHGSIVAFAENLGWKGNVRNVRLNADPRFSDFLTSVADSNVDERRRIASFLAQQFADSKRETQPLPNVGDDVLTFARARVLFHALLDLHSDGYIQQFVIAALLFVYRRRHGTVIITHRAAAADKYDDTAGDIEERRGDELVRAYEVTARDDWKNRISDFKKKMDRYHLKKYVIIAKGINTDDDWSAPASMALKLEEYGRDIAVVDIQDVVNFLAAELTPRELREAVNKAHEYLSDRRLCGRHEFKEAFRETVREWLDTVETATEETGDGKAIEGQAG